jgi:hypothetical protein
MLTIKMAVATGNSAVQNGNLGKVIEATMADIKPECAYFYPQDGKRAAIFVFDLKNAEDIARIAERLFMGLDAEVSFSPVMNAEDLKKGLSSLS